MSLHPEIAAMPRTADDNTDVERVAFICANCNRPYGDGLYHGPKGHAPRGICFDCWAQAWEEVKRILEAGGAWTDQTEMLFLLSQGHSQSKAAHILHVCRRTVGRWLNTYRNRPETIPAPIRDLWERYQQQEDISARLAAAS